MKPYLQEKESKTDAGREPVRRRVMLEGRERKVLVERNGRQNFSRRSTVALGREKRTQ